MWLRVFIGFLLFPFPPPPHLPSFPLISLQFLSEPHSSLFLKAKLWRMPLPDSSPTGRRQKKSREWTDEIIKFTDYFEKIQGGGGEIRVSEDVTRRKGESK